MLADVFLFYIHFYSTLSNYHFIHIHNFDETGDRMWTGVIMLFTPKYKSLPNNMIKPWSILLKNNFLHYLTKYCNRKFIPINIQQFPRWRM